MGDGRAELALDVVTDDRYPGVAEPLRPRRVAGDEDRYGVDKADLRLEAGLRIGLLGGLRTDRQVGHQHVGRRFTQHPGDVHRRGG